MYGNVVSVGRRREPRAGLGDYVPAELGRRDRRGADKKEGKGQRRELERGGFGKGDVGDAQLEERETLECRDLTMSHLADRRKSR